VTWTKFDKKWKRDIQEQNFSEQQLVYLDYLRGYDWDPPVLLRRGITTFCGIAVLACCDEDPTATQFQNLVRAEFDRCYKKTPGHTFRGSRPKPTDLSHMTSPYYTTTLGVYWSRYREKVFKYKLIEDHVVKDKYSKRVYLHKMATIRPLGPWGLPPGDSRRVAAQAAMEAWDTERAKPKYHTHDKVTCYKNITKARSIQDAWFWTNHPRLLELLKVPGQPTPRQWKETTRHESY